MRSKVPWRARYTKSRLRRSPRRLELVRAERGMARAKQLTVSHENRPGMVAKNAKVLGDAKVNILNCLTTTSGTEGVTHLVVDKVNKAKKALANAGLVYIEADVLCVELPNTPGALAKFTGKLAEKNIN